MPADGPATAEGDLEHTPFAHLLVYAVDRRLTGGLILSEPRGAEHTVRIVSGRPVKIRPSDGYARLGEILLAERVISAEILSEALATRGLLGDVLLLSGCLDSATIDWHAQVQFVRRMMRLFELPAETRYRYFDGLDVLADWGGDPATIDPFTLLWAGLRDHGERSTRLVPTLERLGSMPLRLHAAFEPGRFGLNQAELAVIDVLRSSAPSLASLLEAKVAPEPLVCKLVYALAITRFFDFGNGKLPVGVETSSSLPPVSASSLALGRVQLRPTLHRIGAAAPDPAGDGERAPVMSRGRRRPSSEPSPMSSAVEPPPSTRRSLAAAVAAELASAAPSEGEPPASTGRSLAAAVAAELASAAPGEGEPPSSTGRSLAAAVAAERAPAAPGEGGPLSSRGRSLAAAVAAELASAAPSEDEPAQGQPAPPKAIATSKPSGAEGC